MSDPDEDLSNLPLDPAVLQGLSTEERAAAIATARAAQRAEERAEQRALERALERKRQERLRERQQAQDAAASWTTAENRTGVGTARLAYVPKRKRGETTTTTTTTKTSTAETTDARGGATASTTTNTNSRNTINNKQQPSSSATRRPVDWTEQEFSSVRETYLGKAAAATGTATQDAAPKKRKPGATKKITFKFRWDDTDDTFAADNDPLYSWKPNNNNSKDGPSSTNGDHNNHHYHHSKRNVSIPLPRFVRYTISL